MNEARDLALAAAHSAAEAATELMRFAREGEALNTPFEPGVDPVMKLLDAANMAMVIESGWVEANRHTLDDEYFALRADVIAAISRYLEGWA